MGGKYYKEFYKCNLIHDIESSHVSKIHIGSIEYGQTNMHRLAYYNTPSAAYVNFFRRSVPEFHQKLVGLKLSQREIFSRANQINNFTSADCGVL